MKSKTTYLKLHEMVFFDLGFPPGRVGNVANDDNGPAEGLAVPRWDHGRHVIVLPVKIELRVKNIPVCQRGPVVVNDAHLLVDAEDLTVVAVDGLSGPRDTVSAFRAVILQRICKYIAVYSGICRNIHGILNICRNIAIYIDG